jgi:hypothetical protein
MSRKRKPTVDQAYDRRNDPGPETRDLSVEEATAFEAARGAVLTLRKTFEVWTVIGKAVVIARTRADRLGGGKTFRRILEQQGLGSIPDATATWLQRIMARLPNVEAWRVGLSERQQINWASPSAIIKHAKDAAGLPLFPKKVGAQPAFRRPNRMNIEVAIDTITDYCRDLAQDERAALLKRVGRVEARGPTLEEAIEAVVKLSAELPEEGRMELAMRIANQLGLRPGEGWRRVQRARLPRKGKVLSNIGGLPVVMK